MRIFPLLFFGIFLIQSCESPENLINEPSSKLSPGTWLMDVSISEDKSIPFRFEVASDSSFYIVNHTERIAITDVSYFADSLHFHTPQFDSEFVGKINSNNSFSGQWTNHLKDQYSLDFNASHQSTETYTLSDFIKPKKYQVTFSPDNVEDTYSAIGLIEQIGDKTVGTFITETGDYRFLEGETKDGRLVLSCFDGSHLFLFEADYKPDSISNGTFYSGRHWKEPWKGIADSEYELSDPDSLTFLTSSNQNFDFSALNKNNESVLFDSSFYQDKVSIVQIFGTWCPNCLDENLYYKELHKRYSSQGLQIIPIAFEKGDTFEKQVAYVEKQFKSLNIDYPFYIGGQPQKDSASAKFSMLNRVMSYPTSIFVDKSGQVRKIHTGFYGPSTGQYYTDYTESTETFIEALLAEN